MNFNKDFDVDVSSAISRKRATYNILSRTYEQKLEKYQKATADYKQTAEYRRLQEIVIRLRATLTQMEKDLGR